MKARRASPSNPTTVTDHASLLVAVDLDGGVGPSNAVRGERLHAPEAASRPVAGLDPAPVTPARRRDHIAGELVDRLLDTAERIARSR